MKGNREQEFLINFYELKLNLKNQYPQEYIENYGFIHFMGLMALLEVTGK